MNHSGLFQSCPWAKELSPQPPEGSIYSRPGTGRSGEEEDQALKGMRCFTYGSHVSMNLTI